MAKLTKLQEALYAEIQRVTTKLKGTPNLTYHDRVFGLRRGSQYSAGTFRGLIKAGLMVQVSEDKYMLPGGAGKAAAPAQPADNLRQALRDVKAGNTYPVATLWQGIEPGTMVTASTEGWTPAEPGSDAPAETELASRRRVMNEVNDLMYAAMGNPGTRAFNQTSMVDDVKALIQERDDLIVERDTAIAEYKRIRAAFSGIQSALIVARPVVDILSEIAEIIEALAEPVE